MPAPDHLIPLQAGPLSMFLQMDSGVLRYVRFGDLEIVRAVYGAVRDRNWGTVPPSVSDFQINQDSDRFQVRFRVRCRREEIDYRWDGELSGDPNGSVTYRFTGEALSAFERNRIGLCVLHPMTECAGQPCEVEHPDGQVELSRFPIEIAPWQPFQNITALRHPLDPDQRQRVEIRFEGDLFETEDQRNWTDASFKTYCTPLALPFPVPVRAGDRVVQTVTISLAASGPAPRPKPTSHSAAPLITIDTSRTQPRAPVGLVLGADTPSVRQESLLRNLALDHLRIDLSSATEELVPQLEDATEIARRLQTSLHAAITLPGDSGSYLDALVEAVERVHPPIALWLIFEESEIVTSPAVLELARARLQSVTPVAHYAAGTKAWFTELNRNRPDPKAAAFPCYTLNPQVHAFDNLSLIETLAAQPLTVQSTRRFSPQPVVISWISLRPQTNPNATAPAADDPSQLPASVDVRQCSLFGAVWTLGSLARLLPAEGVHTLTYYEAIGWRGLMERECGSPLPDKFPSQPGAVFPLYHVLADLAGHETLHPTATSRPLQVDALTLVDAQGRRRVVVANFLPETQKVRIRSGPFQGKMRLLEDSVLQQASLDPERFGRHPGETVRDTAHEIEVELPPYAIARLSEEA